MRLVVVPTVVLLAALAGCASVPPTAGAPSPQAGATNEADASGERTSEPDEAGKGDPMLADAGVPHQVVKEAFVTPATPSDNIDSPAAWRAPDGKTWLMATAKEGVGVVLYDGDNGNSLEPIGTAGKALGQFDRPNGIFVQPLAGSPGGEALLFVVERDNHRVQVLLLPALKPLGTFGDNDLQQPYGIWLRPDGEARNTFEVLVTDAYMAGKDARDEDVIPALDKLARRVHRYRVTLDGDRIIAQARTPFGDTTPAGAIRIPESIWGDTANGRLLIAEEDVPTGTGLREYGLDGRYRGRDIGMGLFKAQAEGIALWQCQDGSGYWIATDQFKDRSLFHVFDRRTLAHVGAFAGATVSNTDGIWLHQRATARFPAGVLYAVHDDQAVGAFDWRDVANALKLPTTCDAKTP